MSHVKHQQALAENLIGNVCEPRSGHIWGQLMRRETNHSTSLPLQLWKREIQRLHCVQQSDGFVKTCINQLAMCPVESFERYHTLKNYKNFSVVPIVYWVLVVCKHRTVRALRGKEYVYILYYRTADNLSQLNTTFSFHTWCHTPFLALCWTHFAFPLYALAVPTFWAKQLA
jgi:hypothetical protein